MDLFKLIVITPLISIFFIGVFVLVLRKIKKEAEIMKCGEKAIATIYNIQYTI